jgi:hypothetical protein
MRKRARSLSLKSASILDFFPQLRHEVGVSVVKSSEQEHILMRRKKTKQQQRQNSNKDKTAEATVPLIHMHITRKLCSQSHGRGDREKCLAEGHESGWQPFGRRRKRHSRCASGTLTIFVNLPAPISTFSLDGAYESVISREFKPPRLSSVDEGHTV